jgi:hypothetical protein
LTNQKLSLLIGLEQKPKKETQKIKKKESNNGCRLKNGYEKNKK